MDATHLLELGGVILGLAFLARAAGRFGIPAIPLYLLAGLAFGEGGILPLVTTQEFIRTGSELGLILLLFMLGLEYSARELVSTVKRSVATALVDIALNFTPGLAAGLLLGWGIVPAMFLGGVTLVTSSGIAAKIIGDLGWGGRPEGTFVVSLCIIEDLTMAVYLPILGALLLGGATAVGVGSALAAIAGVVIVLGLALRLELGLSRLLFSRSDEAVLLTILGLAIVVAGLAELVEISAAVGALIIGMVLSGPAAHGASQLVKPVRDLFAALFFAFIGLQVDPASLPPVLGVAIGLGVAGALTKLATARFGGKRMGLSPQASNRAAAALIPRGEFSLAIAGLGVASGLERRLAALTIAYVLILAVAGPVVARVVGGSTRRLEGAS